MRKLTLLFSMLCLTALAHAQDFSIQSSSSSLSISPGQSESVDIHITRSKSLQKSTVQFGLSSALPEGIQIAFNTENAFNNEVTATISASPTVAPGEYMVILRSTIQNKSRGTTLQIKIAN